MKCFAIFHSKSNSVKSSPNPSDQNPSRTSKPATNLIHSAGLSSSPRTIPEIYEEKGHRLKKFSFSELRNVTSNFNKLLKIGEGGFGSVYKARIKLFESQNHPLVVAIKRLNKQSMQGHKQWLAEVQFLGVLDHPNLVKLLGYCSVDNERGMQRLLVYEYMPNKSLAVHLFSETLPPIPWKTRLRILLGAAEGLAYLHEGLETQVIFRDFKTSNVLLDKDFNPKLSDFGLAREGPQGDRTHVSTKRSRVQFSVKRVEHYYYFQPVGTCGYVAPEYVETGHLKSKSDVWSYGVVLFEVLTGRRAVDRNLPKTEQKLIEWVKKFRIDSVRFWMIMDRRLGNQYNIEAARKIAKLAGSCLSKNPNDRPAMSRIVESLRDVIGEPDQV